MTEPLSEPSLANGHAQNGTMAIGNGNHGNHMPLKPESSGMKAAEASGDAPSGEQCLGVAAMLTEVHYTPPHEYVFHRWWYLMAYTAQVI